jgi:hypothetical protein
VTAEASGAQARHAIAAIRAVQARGEVRGDTEPSDGPPVACIATADLDWLADKAADRDERWRSA